MLVVLVVIARGRELTQALLEWGVAPIERRLTVGLILILHSCEVHILLMLLPSFFHVELLGLRMTFVFVDFWIWVVKHVALSCLDDTDVVDVKLPFVIEVLILSASCRKLIFIHVELQNSAQVSVHFRVI